MYEVCPYGERRADLRSAVMTANLLTSQSANSVDSAEFREIVKKLASYLPATQEESLSVDAAILKDMPNAR